MAISDITDLKLAIPALSLPGTSIDRTNQDFDAKLKATIGEGFGAQIYNCNIDTRLSAIEWPVRCRGNLVGPTNLVLGRVRNLVAAWS